MEMMTNQFNTRKCSCNQLWFVFLITNLLCVFLLLLLHRSSIVSTKVNLNCLVVKTNLNLNVIKQEAAPDSCTGRYIYVHEIPTRFNEEVVQDCHSLTRRTDKIDMCSYTTNSGFGPNVGNSWFLTNQFMLEVIFHSRMKTYDCLTNDSSVASAVFVPFYAGLDLRRHLWGRNTFVRDASGVDLVTWLAKKSEWQKMSGRDHFLVGGRIARDFRRKSDRNSEWGSNFRNLPESQNMTMLTIESSSSWTSDVAIPYPTYFHPSSDEEVFRWQHRMRQQNRKYLFSFVGAPRSRSKGSIRGNIIDQCLNSKGSCNLLDCSSNDTDCDNPTTVMEALKNSIFCLQPPGDSLTRRSIFDSILAGCIPVFFHPGSAYEQYRWHLPKNNSKYSVYISGKELRDKNFRINETLAGVSKGAAAAAMREEVIRLIPRVIYGDPRSRLRTFEDAFDIAVKGILGRIEESRRESMWGNLK